MGNFFSSAKWNKKNDYADSGSTVKDQGPLKPKLELATRQIQIEIVKLEASSKKLKEKDSAVFQKIIVMIKNHDSEHAHMLANELAEIRKMSKFVLQAKLAFEQIELRIRTISDLGDIASSLSPALGVIKGIAPSLGTVIPEAQSEISEISDLLSGILVDAGQTSHSSFNLEPVTNMNEEAEKILTEAGLIVEQNVREKLPDLPASLVRGENYEQTEEEAI